MKKAGQISTLFLLVAFVGLTGLFVDRAFLRRPQVQSSVTEKPMANPSSLLNEVNRYRVEAGSRPLELEERLNSSAQTKCNDMVTNDYWSHVSPSGLVHNDLIVAAGVYFAKAGENLYFGSGSSTSTVKAWSESPEHNKNMLDPRFTHVGFGVCGSDDFQKKGQQTVVVQHLAV